MAKKGAVEESDNKEKEEVEITDENQEDTKRGKGGRFKKKPPVKEDTKEIPLKKDTSLMDDIATDLRAEIKEKFGKIDLSYLDVEDEVKTMRSMLKGKKDDPKKKVDVSDTKDSTIEPEWQKPKSFLDMHMEGKKLKNFYDSKKSVGGNLFEQIFGDKK